MPNIFKQYNNAINGRSNDALPNLSSSRVADRQLFNGIGPQPPIVGDSGSSMGTIWDDLEQELRSQNGLVPQDPAPTNNVNRHSMRVLTDEEKRDKLEEIKEELLFTLGSKVTGYTDLDELTRDFAIDSGFIPERVALEYGFLDFGQFVNSDLMREVVKVVMIDGQEESAYVPRNCDKFKHIRDEQIISNDTIVRKEVDEENEKTARALLPQNCERFINGKKVILRILYEFGGENEPILWTRVQQKYKEETGKELAGEELRKMFQRDKALKIMISLFQNEVEVWENEVDSSHFSLKLRMPYGEIMRRFDETIRLQREAAMKNCTNKRQPFYNTAPRKPTLEERFKATRPLFPTPLDTTQFMQEGTSRQGEASSQSQFPNREENSTVQINDEIGLPACLPNPSDKCKFVVPSDAKKAKFDNNEQITQRITTTNTNNARKEFNWNEESLPHFDASNANNNDEVLTPTPKANNVTKRKSSVKYTSMADGGTYTDTEDEQDDATSEGTMMDHNEGPSSSGTNVIGGTLQKQLQNQHGNDINAHNHSSTRTNSAHIDRAQNSTTISGPILVNKPVGHQVVIQKYMKERMEQKGKTPIHLPKPNISPMFMTSTNQQQNLSNIDENDSNRSTQQSTYQRQHEPNIGITMENSRQIHYQTATNNVIPAPSNVAESVYSCVLDPLNGFMLMEQVDELRLLANKFGFSHETRHDEGSFSFRRGDKLLIFTEFDDSKIRASWHKEGRIYKERYFPKVDWNMFSATIRGLLSDILGE